jgi:hypothetical protein
VLQSIADGMAAIYADIARVDAGELVAVQYLGGAEVSLPQWLLRCDMKKLIEPLRQKLCVNWDLAYMTRKYEVLSIVPLELAKMLGNIQTA